MDKDFVILKNVDYTHLLEDIKNQYGELKKIAENQEILISETKSIMDTIIKYKKNSDQDLEEDEQKKYIYNKSKFILQGFTLGVLFSAFVCKFFSFL